MSALTNNNRLRHSKLISNRVPLPADWKFGPFGKRLGSVRSADGVILNLPQSEKPSVAKFVFIQDKSDLEAVGNEVRISKLMSNAGIGPKIYYAKILKLPKDFSIDNNLLSHGVGKPRAVAIIVMENLYDGKRVVKAYTAQEALNNGWYIPVSVIARMVKKMHSLGIIHADMHPGNIMIQQIRRLMGGFYYRPIIIDYGRSIMLNHSLTNQNANNYGREGRTKKNAWWFKNGATPVLLNSNALALLQRKRAAKKKVKTI